MNDETQMITKETTTKETTKVPGDCKDDVTHKSESGILSISIRGWLSLIVVYTVCLMSVFKLEVKEPLYTMCGMMIAFYYAQNKQPNKP